MSELLTSNIIIEQTTHDNYIGYDLTKKIYGEFDTTYSKNSKNETFKVFRLITGINIVDDNNISLYYDKKVINIKHKNLLIETINYKDSYNIHTITYGANYEVNLKSKNSSSSRILISNKLIEMHYGGKFELDIYSLTKYHHFINDIITLPIVCNISNEFNKMAQLINQIFVDYYKKLIVKLEKKDEEIKCAICLDKKPIYIIMKCAHLVFCEDCEKLKNNKCPFCRCNYNTTKKIYY